MLTRDELRETEDFFFDLSAVALAKADARPYASDNEWNLDAPPRTNDTARDLSAVARGAKADCGRIMVIGFHVVRL
jgi:hypothetical protein